MVGEIFRVILTGYAQCRRRQIDDFETRVNGKPHANKVQREISKQANKLENLPGAYPLYLDHNEDFEVRYHKAFDYKIIFRVFKKVGEVLILTIRNDAEDPNKIKDEL
jgi:plasmid stabilization system protein ParE